MYISNMWVGTYKHPIRIDIIHDVIYFNRKELDNKSRKNVASYLGDIFPLLGRKYCVDIRLQKNEKLIIYPNCSKPKEIKDNEVVVRLCRPKYKKEYHNLKFYGYIRNGSIKYVMKEGYRYLPLAEIHNVIDLIIGVERNETFCIDLSRS